MPYDPGKGYGTTTPATAAGQGQTAVDAALTDPADVPANTTGTSTASARYYNQPVPGTRKLIDHVPGAGDIGNLWGPGKTLGQMQSDLYQLGVNDTESLVSLQTQLIQAGLLDPRARQFSLGSVSPGDPTDTAYTRLLSEAIKTGSPYGVLLSDLATNPRNTRGQRNYDFLQQVQAGQKAGARSSTRLDVIDLQSPETLRDAAHAAFKDVTGMGRAQKDALVEKFVSAFQARQVAANRTVNSAQDQIAAVNRAGDQVAASGGTPATPPVSQEVQVAAPDMTSAATAYARNAAPAAAGAHDISKQFSSFLKLLGGVI